MKHLFLATQSILTSFSIAIAMDGENPKSKMELDMQHASVLRPLYEAKLNIFFKLSESEKNLDSYPCMISVLDRLNARYRVIEHEAEGQSDKVSMLRGSSLTQSAKMMVVITKLDKKGRNKMYTLTVIPSDRRLSFERITAHYEGHASMAAPLERAQELTKAVSGAILPFSFNESLKMIVDASLLTNPEVSEIAFNGLLDCSLFLNVEDYETVAQPEIQHIIQD